MISLNNLTARFGGRMLFRNVSIQFNPGCRYGLVGANGAGKTTLLRFMSGEQAPEEGDIAVPKHIKIGTLKQDHFLYEKETILSTVIQGDAPLWRAVQHQTALLAKAHLNSTEAEEMAEVEREIARLDGYMAESVAAKLLVGLGIPGPQHHQNLSTLSGGYKLRVLLAQLLFGKPDILLLDEPNNHLDIYAIGWLEEYLQQFSGTVIVSSHDRHFLTTVCTHIADVDYSDIRIYVGNFERFVAAKALERERQELMLAKQEKRRAEIQEFIDRFKAKASKARQAVSRMGQVEKLTHEIEELDLQPTSRRYPRVNFTFTRPSGVSPLRVVGIGMCYGDKRVLKDVSFEVERGERIALIGANGIGKSTLLQILTKNRIPTEGNFYWGHGVSISYFPQDHHSLVHGGISLFDWLGQWVPDVTDQTLRDLLGRVLFTGDDVKRSVSTLSGGEVARLILAKMMLEKANILVFDEPTNHLDLEAIDALMSSLTAFEGTVLFVSHNSYFVSQLATRILELKPEGLVDFRGTYPEYLQANRPDHLARGQLQSRRTATTSSEGRDSHEERKKQRNQRAALVRRVDTLEKTCTELEEQLKVFHRTMAVDGYYAKTSASDVQAALAQCQELEAKLAACLTEWESASQQI